MFLLNNVHVCIAYNKTINIKKVSRVKREDFLLSPRFSKYILLILLRTINVCICFFFV